MLRGSGSGASGLQGGPGGGDLPRRRRGHRQVGRHCRLLPMRTHLGGLAQVDGRGGDGGGRVEGGAERASGFLVVSSLFATMCSLARPLTQSIHPSIQSVGGIIVALSWQHQLAGLTPEEEQEADRLSHETLDKHLHPHSENSSRIPWKTARNKCPCPPTSPGLNPSRANCSTVKSNFSNF